MRRSRADHVAAAAWFDEPLAGGDWVNATWIYPASKAEVRMIDIVGADARHRVLVRSKPGDIDERWDNIDYDGVQQIADRLRKASTASGVPLLDFAGPMASLPSHLQVDQAT